MSRFSWLSRQTARLIRAPWAACRRSLTACFGSWRSRTRRSCRRSSTTATSWSRTHASLLTSLYRWADGQGSWMIAPRSGNSGPRVSGSGFQTARVRRTLPWSPSTSRLQKHGPNRHRRSPMPITTSGPDWQVNHPRPNRWRSSKPSGPDQFSRTRRKFQ